LIHSIISSGRISLRLAAVESAVRTWVQYSCCTRIFFTITVSSNKWILPVWFV